jgi:glycosyltransferase involved in cell wall biosynthesis
VSETSPRQLRVLHLVSHDGVAPALQQTLFLPLVARLPKQRVKAEVISFGPGFAPATVLRQNGVPVHEVGLSRKRFAFGAFKNILNTARRMRPDVIQAWGPTAQIVSVKLRARCSWGPKVVWSVTDGVPLTKNAGFIDKYKLKQIAKIAAKADRIIYTSESAAATHRRAGYPEDGYRVIAPGVDAARFKPDVNARRKIREQLGIAPNAFVIGMIAPCVPESDHATLIKGVGELIKTNPNLTLVLAGHGVQKGNAALMSLVGGGTLGARTKLLGEWSDLASFYNACDIACSTALVDSHRLTLAAAMLCGTPCVATGIGAQGEVLGDFGVSIEQGSPTALTRGIMRVMQMQPERRMFLAQGARKHALKNFVGVRSLQAYLQLYFDAVGRQAAAADDVPTPEIDSAIPQLPPELQAAPHSRPKEVKVNADSSNGAAEWADPDSLEARPAITQSPGQPPVAADAAAKPEVVAIPKPASVGDVLQIFEADTTNPASATAAPMNERARGVADEMEDLIAPDVLETKVERTVVAMPSAQFKARKKPAAESKPASDAAASPSPLRPKTRPVVPVNAESTATTASPSPTPSPPIAKTLPPAANLEGLAPTVPELVALKLVSEPPPAPAPVAATLVPVVANVPVVTSIDVRAPKDFQSMATLTLEPTMPVLTITYEAVVAHVAATPIVVVAEPAPKVEESVTVAAAPIIVLAEPDAGIEETPPLTPASPSESPAELTLAEAPPSVAIVTQETAVTPSPTIAVASTPSEPVEALQIDFLADPPDEKERQRA